MRALLVLSSVSFLAACAGHGTTFLDMGDAADPDSGVTSDDGGTIVLGDSASSDAGVGDAKPVNLIPNGDFEKGNMLFGSDYTYAVTNTVEGEYTVGTSGKAFNGWLVDVGDHTTGKTKMFIGNGKATPDRVWFMSTPLAVTPQTDYFFEAFVMNLCCSGGLGNGKDPVGPSVLSFYANDQLIGTRTSQKLGVWEGLSTMWHSGSATKVTLKLVNANTDAAGNDFAVDDIYLGTESTVNPPN